MGPQENLSIQAHKADLDIEAADEADIPLFANLVDVAALQSMMDDFYGVTRYPRP